MESVETMARERTEDDI